MYNPTVIGVDPGIVHSGMILLDFEVEQRQLTVDHAVIDGTDSQAARAVAEVWAGPRPYSTLDIFIEQYRPRSGFSVDQQMMSANTDFRRDLGGKLLRNMGVKKVVTKELLELLHVWTFGTRTHHQDLRSAADPAGLGGAV